MLSVFVTKQEFLDAHERASALKAQIHELEHEHMKCFEIMAISVDLFFKFCRDGKLDVTVLAAPPELWHKNPVTNLSRYDNFNILKKNPPSTTFVPDAAKGFFRLWLRDVLDSHDAISIASVSQTHVEIHTKWSAGRGHEKPWSFYLPLNFVLDKETEYTTFMNFVREMYKFECDAEVSREVSTSIDLAILETLVRKHPNQAKTILDGMT
jgi:hypothetical protein